MSVAVSVGVTVALKELVPDKLEEWDMLEEAVNRLVGERVADREKDTVAVPEVLPVRVGTGVKLWLEVRLRLNVGIPRGVPLGDVSRKQGHTSVVRIVAAAMNGI
jgi:hypothetical protein